MAILFYILRENHTFAQSGEKEKSKKKEVKKFGRHFPGGENLIRKQ